METHDGGHHSAALSVFNVTVQQAAQALSLSVRQVQRDLEAGCPCLTEGSVGGKGARLDLDAYRQWRAARRGDALAVLEDLVYECALDDIAERARITRPQLYFVLLMLYERAHERLRHEPVLDPPERMRRLGRIVLHSLESGEFQHRRE